MQDGTSARSIVKLYADVGSFGAAIGAPRLGSPTNEGVRFTDSRTCASGPPARSMRTAGVAAKPGTEPADRRGQNAARRSPACCLLRFPPVTSFHPAIWQAAIVDLDGTMVDTVGDFEVALGRMLADLGLGAIDRGFIARTIGKGSDHLIRATLAQVGADPALADAAWQRYQHHYREINGEYSTVFPGVSEGLQRLVAAGLKLGCLTNKPTAFARALLAAKRLDGYFAVVFGGDAFARKKPDPLPLIETCRALGSLPARTLMIGDSANDAAAARAAGCDVVLVTYGYNHGEPIIDVAARQHLDRLDALVL